MAHQSQEHAVSSLIQINARERCLQNYCRIGQEARRMDHKAKIPAVPAAGDAKSVVWWRGAHRLLLQLCDDLEAIADSLPSNIVNQDCLFAAKSLGRLIREVHAYEEENLFPALRQFFDASPDIAAAIDRLTFEHLADECYADDIAEKLLYIGSGGRDVNMEALGYMLRGFFEALRRHIAFERDHFSSAVEQLQTAAE
jgi:hemerythrin-like domain-containing protein